MKSLFWLSSPPFASSSMDSLLLVIRKDQYSNALLEGLEKRLDGFLTCLFFHSLWPSFQWNPHAPWPLLREVHHLYFLLFQVMVAVVRCLVSETTGFLVTHYGNSFMDFLGVFPLETFPVDQQSFFCMALFTTLVTGYTWPGRWPSYRVTTVSTTVDLEINLLQSFVDSLFNGHSLWLRKWRLF